MIIDINAYYGQWPYWRMHWLDENSMLRNMDRLGIERAFVASLRAAFTDVATGNEEVLALCRRHPDRFSPALTYYPFSKERGRYAEDCAEFPFRLIKLFPIASLHTYDPLEEPFFDELMEFCAARRIPVLVPYRLMLSWRLPIFDIKKIGAMALKHPQTTFIIGAFNYLLELQSSLDVLRRAPNTLIETSCMMAFREIESVVDAIGADRILHGTGFPLQNPAIGPLKIQTAEIPDADKAKILYVNSRKLLGLAE